MFSRKRRTVANSSDCNLRGVVTTKAEAGPTSVTKKEKDRAREVQRRKKEFKAEETRQLLVELLLVLFLV